MTMIVGTVERLGALPPTSRRRRATTRPSAVALLAGLLIAAAFVDLLMIVGRRDRLLGGRVLPSSSRRLALRRATLGVLLRRRDDGFGLRKRSGIDPYEPMPRVPRAAPHPDVFDLVARRGAVADGVRIKVGVELEAQKLYRVERGKDGRDAEAEVGEVEVGRAEDGSGRRRRSHLSEGRRGLL